MAKTSYIYFKMSSGEDEGGFFFLKKKKKPCFGGSDEA
jgi:hypothetical protein